MQDQSTRTPPADVPPRTVLGYTACKSCGAAVLNEVAYKTDGHCAECFRLKAAEILAPVMTVVAGRERLVLRTNRSKRSPGDRAQRARARARRRQDPDVKAHTKLVTQCADRARRRLATILPELYEILLADERANAGLNAWTIERALTPGECSSSLPFLENYHHIEPDTATDHGN
jgi:hypothetical protein